MREINDILQIRPGRVGALLLDRLATEVSDSTVIESIRAAMQIAHENKVQFVQSLLQPDDRRATACLKSCGFAAITEVLYLVCPCEAISSAKSSEELQLVAVDDSIEMQNRLSALILGTYEGSRDCPQLNGLRKPADVLESYRAVGRYSPQHWWIVQIADVDAGCLILAAHDVANECEIVYMAVLPPFRRRGLGTKMIELAKRVAVNSGVAQLGLAVDAENLPALSLYLAAGFAERAKHRLFLRRI